MKKYLDNNVKRIISILTIAVLMLNVMPMTSLATSEENDADKEAQTVETAADEEDAGEGETVDPKDEEVEEAPVDEEETVDPKDEEVEELPVDEEETVDPKDEEAEEAPVDEEETVDPKDEETVEASADVEEAAPAIETGTSDNENKAVEETEDKEDEELKYPGFQASIDTGLVRITLDVPEGAFPENTEVRHKIISDGQVRDAVEDALDAGAGQISAVDIYFYNLDQDKEIEPLVPVSMSVDAYGIQADNYKVVHIDDDGDAELAASSVSSDFEFAADSFSIYSIVGDEGGIVRRTYDFYNGDTLVCSQIVKNGDRLYEPGLPEQEGATFVGWSADGGNSYLNFDEEIRDIDTKAKADERVELHAVFGKHTEVYFYDRSGKNIIKTVSSHAGDKINVDEVKFELMEGEYVSGWTTSKDQTPAGAVSGTVTLGEENLELYPIVKSVKWLIFHGNGSDKDPAKASFTEPYYVKESENTHAPTAPKRPGYSFKEWTTDTDGSDAFTFGQRLSEDTVLYAQWNPEEVEYQVLVWKESLVDEKYVEDHYSLGNHYTYKAPSGSEVTLTEDSALISGLKSNKGYKFYVFKKIDDAVTVKGDGTTTINVYFALKEYRIEFRAFSEEYRGHGGGVIFYTFANPTSSHFLTDIGKYISSSFTHDGIEYTNCEPYTIVAHYGEDIESRWPSYLTSWQYTEEGLQKKEEGAFKNSLEKVEDAVPMGWNCADDNILASGRPGTLSTKFTNMTETLMNANGTDTLHCHLQFLEGAVYKNANYWLENIEDEAFSRSERYSCEIAAARNAGFGAKSLEGFTLMGGATNPEVPEGYPGYDDSGEIIYYHFYYKRNLYPLVFYNYNHVDKEYAGETAVKYEKPLASFEYTPNRPAAVPKEYEFKGWFTTEACIAGTEFSFEDAKMPVDGLTLYAKWDAPEYTVSFNSNGGSPVEDQIVPFGKSAAEPEEPKRDGYEFAGWIHNNNPFNFDEEIYKDTELVAKWLTGSVIQIKYDAGEHGVNAPTDEHSYTDVSEARVKEGPQAEAGYIFKGWRLKDALYKPGELMQVLSSDAVKVSDDKYQITLKAEYGEEPDEVAITYFRNHPAVSGDKAKTKSPYNQNNGEFVLPDMSELDFEDAAEAPGEGYVFIGWSTNADGSGKVYKAGDTVAADREGSNELYGVWERLTYTIKYDPNGGALRGSKEIAEETHYYGEVISIAEAPEKEGYKFLFWKGSEYQPGDSYTVTEDHTFTAQWESYNTPEESSPPEDPENPGTPDIQDGPEKTDKRTPSGRIEKKGTPKTGDSSDAPAWIALTAFASVCAYLVYRRREKRKL